MTINKMSDGSRITFELEGRLDTITSPEFEKELNENLPDVTDLIIDLSKTEYISSAGLRVLLSAQKTMNRKENGKMLIRGINDVIMEIFEVTGFVDILTIEEQK